MTDAWVPEKRPVPEELTEDFQAPPYRAPLSTPVMERLDHAMRERLEAFKLMGSGLGDAGD